MLGYNVYAGSSIVAIYHLFIVPCRQRLRYETLLGCNDGTCGLSCIRTCHG